MLATYDMEFSAANNLHWYFGTIKLFYNQKLNMLRNSCFYIFLDIDECQTVPKPCHRLASCTNTVGSFKCSCVEGYHGDGTSICEGQIRLVGNICRAIQFWFYHNNSLYFIIKATQ